MIRRIVLFNKPYDVLCQFTDSHGRKTLSDYIILKHIYAAGRLDRDSEGLVLLTDDGQLQHHISAPKYKLPKCYWVQIEGIMDEAALQTLREGVHLNDGKTRPAHAHIIQEPDNLWPRDPPIRYRKTIPTSWLEITLTEGRNRQVRRMTAAVGYPTLRLIRHRIGGWRLGSLAPGEWLIVK